MKLKNLFWGIFFILGGIAVIANQMGYLIGINVFTLVGTIFLVAIMIQSSYHLNFAGILFPLAIIGIIYQNELGISNITPWPILIAALFGSIGLTIIFHKSIKVGCINGWDDYKKENVDQVIDIQDESNINFSVNFGSTIKYVNSEDFKRANISCSFGAAKVYFDNAKVNPNGAVINLDISFAGVEIFIPKTWKIVDNCNVSLGGIDEKNHKSNEDGPIVTLTGKVALSGVEIIYI